MFNFRFVCLITCLLFCVGLAAELTTDWFGAYGGTGTEEATATCFDSAGNYYIAGNFSGSLTIGSQTLSSGAHTFIFVAKFNSAGQFLWATQSSGSSGNTCYASLKSICADVNNNLYICGNFKDKMGFEISGASALSSLNYNDIFVAKLNSSGAFEWAKQAGGSADNDYAYSICIGADNSPVLCGDFSGNATLFGTSVTSSGSKDIFVAKLDPSDGSRLHLSHFGSSGADTANSICAISNGNYAICGTYNGSIAFGSTNLNDIGREAYICNLDTNLAPLWAKSSNGTGDQDGDTISANGSSIVISGRYTNAVNFGYLSLSAPLTMYALFVAKLDLSGNFVWLTSMEATTSAGKCLASYINANAELYLAGVFTGSLGALVSNGSSDGFILKLRCDGDSLWAQSWGGTGADFAYSICGNPAGQVLCAGYNSAGIANILGNQVTNYGTKDIFAILFSETSAMIPASPQNVRIFRTAETLQLAWDAVTVSQTGSPLPVSAYHIYHSNTLLEEDFQLLGICTGTSYILSGAETGENVRFYRVIAVP